MLLRLVNKITKTIPILEYFYTFLIISHKLFTNLIYLIPCIFDENDTFEISAECHS